MKESIAETLKYTQASFDESQKIDKYYCGTEREQYIYPPNQWFAKGLPLFDAQDQLIRTSTQCAVKMTLSLSCKKRRSALYCPTWGPFAGRQLYHLDAKSRIYQPAMIKYRTAGMRRTWQNMNRWGVGSTDNTAHQIIAHPREDPYVVPPVTYPTSVPLPPTVAPPPASTSSGGSQAKMATTVTYSKDSDTVRFSIPNIFPRKHRTKRDQSPGRMLDEDMMEDLQQGP